MSSPNYAGDSAGGAAARKEADDCRKTMQLALHEGQSYRFGAEYGYRESQEFESLR
ncbi:MAG: hypothetical protein IKV56_00985 [Kiritimatiellae bacterium]|nr:hypothetical protein [Kiritimatiellia bacterium]